MATRRNQMRDWPARATAIAVALCVALAACSGPATGTPTQVLSFVSPTPRVLPVVTSTLIPEPTPQGGETPTDTPTFEAAAASPTPAGPCTNNARFVADVTVPDGTEFLAGQPIDKQWRVRNTGTCDWGGDYRLVLVSGNALGAPSEVALYPAKGGTEAILELSMVAPAEPGAYTGRWQARSPTARLFGDRIFVTINVAPITATVTVTTTH